MSTLLYDTPIHPPIHPARQAAGNLLIILGLSVLSFGLLNLSSRRFKPLPTLP
jgi:hypothetical protein